MVADDGTVYAIASDFIYALNPDGTPKWSYDAPGNLDDTPAVAGDGTAYFSLGSVMYAVNADGAPKWSYTHPLGYAFGAPACDPGGKVYATCMLGLTALGADGTLLWEYSDPSAVAFTAPVVDTDGKVYYLKADGSLVALAADGALRWQTDGSLMYRQGVALGAEHQLYLFGAPPGGDPALYALDADGNLLWQAATDSASFSNLLVNTDGAIIYGEGSEGATVPEMHHLHAVSALGAPLWTTELKGAVLPRLANDAAGNIYCTASLYVANANNHGRVYALDHLGAVQWASGTGGVPSGSAVVGVDGRVYAGFDNGNVFALNPDGTLSWKYETDGSLASSSPAVADDGTVYVPSIDGRFIAINDGGTLAWEYAASYSIIASSPTLGPDGAIYYGDYGDTTQPIGNNGVLTALYPDGTLLWSTILDATVYTSVTISPDNMKYVASAYGDLRAYDASGVEQWQLDLAPSAPQYSSVALGADGSLFTAGTGNSLISLNPDSTTQWTYPAGSQVFSTPALGVDGTVYFGTLNNKLIALNGDGTLAWEFTSGGAVYGSPAVDGAGRIYFGSWDGSLYALNADGTLLWTYATGDEIWGSPSIGQDGTVYIGSNDGGLYAFGPGEG